MDDTLPATDSSSISQHEKNIAMLFDTLKELKMSTEDRSGVSIYSKVGSEYQLPAILQFKSENDYND